MLELLVERDRTVGDLLTEVGLEPSNLSQQLVVLRRAGVVISSTDGSSVVYSIASPAIAELLGSRNARLAVDFGVRKSVERVEFSRFSSAVSMASSL